MVTFFSIQGNAVKRTDIILEDLHRFFARGNTVFANDTNLRFVKDDYLGESENAIVYGGNLNCIFFDIQTCNFI